MGIEFGAPVGMIPRAGSPAGDMARDSFYADLLKLFGDTRLLWVPEPTETTTSTDRSRNARTITYNESVVSFDAVPEVLGAGTAVNFNGTDEEADTPDVDALSFGDSVLDSPFSVVVLCNPDAVTDELVHLLSKWDNSDGSSQLREWRVTIDGSGYPTIELYDESANAYIGRQDRTALTVSTWVMLTFTYDGSRSNTGLRVYVDASRLDDANVTSGTYVAMETLATVVNLATMKDTGATPATSGEFDGKIALAAVIARQLQPDNIWAVKELLNAFYDLEL